MSTTAKKSASKQATATETEEVGGTVTFRAIGSGPFILNKWKDHTGAYHFTEEKPGMTDAEKDAVIRWNRNGQPIGKRDLQRPLMIPRSEAEVIEKLTNHPFCAQNTSSGRNAKPMFMLIDHHKDMLDQEEYSERVLLFQQVVLSLSESDLVDFCHVNGHTYDKRTPMKARVEVQNKWNVSLDKVNAFFSHFDLEKKGDSVKAELKEYYQVMSLVVQGHKKGVIRERGGYLTMSEGDGNSILGRNYDEATSALMDTSSNGLNPLLPAIRRATTGR